jgi:hypothetical protein
MMTKRQHALTNLLKTQPEVRTGSLREILHVIDRQIGLPIPPAKFPCHFEPKAARWDRSSRTVHLYEFSSAEPFPDGTFEAIQDFAQHLHNGCGCTTSLWITDSDGLNPVKVWDVRDELIWISSPDLHAVA